jgi:hypothetical protein
LETKYGLFSAMEAVEAHFKKEAIMATYLIQILDRPRDSKRQGIAEATGRGKKDAQRFGWRG